MNMRLYWPKPEVLDGSWAPPGGKAGAISPDCNVRYWHLADIGLCAAQCTLLGVKRT